MAKYNIKSSNGLTTRFSGYPTYNGNFMKVSYLEFREICSSTPIQWQIGDYVDYEKTGLRYKLYNIPQPTKKARSGESGESFVYSNVQFYADTKKMDIALFRDLVVGDNNIHFSTQQAISTYENVEGIADRLQACMDEYDNGHWEFEVTIPQSGETILTEEREFTMSGGSVLDALQKIYEVWDEEVGWFHSYSNGVNTITIASIKDVDASLQTNTFLYGKGLGLKCIKKSQANLSEMATRLYVYGSNRNLYPNYYRGKDIKDAQSVDIQNLMLPISSWGTTYDEEAEEYLPDARKAYIENASAISNFGLIPKSVYFDGGDNEEIYPSIKGVTIGEIKDAKEELEEEDYVPNPSIYTDDDERVDEVLSVTNPIDDGTTTTGGGRFQDIETENFPNISATKTIPAHQEYKSITFDSSDYQSMQSITTGDYSSNLTITSDLVLHITSDTSYKIDMVVLCNGAEKSIHNIAQSSGNHDFTIPDINVGVIDNESTLSVKFRFTAYTTFDSPLSYSFSFNTIKNQQVPTDKYVVNFCLTHSLSNAFVLGIKQIGFNIADRGTLGDGIMIHFLTGKCAGRSFKVKRTTYVAATDSWSLNMYRGKDEDLDMYFPNTTFPVAIDDRFVILDIAMPELYISIASNRLKSAGEKLLAKTAKIEPYYDPEIDPKKMIENLTTYPSDDSYKLREGKYFVIQDTDIIGATAESILIDSITIAEGESEIPTYKVTLRETKKVSFQQSTANKINSLEQKVVDSSGTLKSTSDTTITRDSIKTLVIKKSSSENWGTYDPLSDSPQEIEISGGGSGGATELNDLSDVSISFLDDSQMLVYVGGNISKWLNLNPEGVKNALGLGNVDNTSDANKPVSTATQTALNAKYSLPINGIPYSDLDNEVKDSLNLADTALQEHQDISGKEDKTNKVTSINSSSTDTQYPSAKCVYDAIQDIDIDTLPQEIVESKPAASALTMGKIYCVDTGNDTYEKWITIDRNDERADRYIWSQLGGGGSGVTDFNYLDNRPKYKGTLMTGSTNIPEVKTETWDAKAETNGTYPNMNVGNATNATKATKIVNQSGGNDVKIYAGSTLPASYEQDTLYIIF